MRMFEKIRKWFQDRRDRKAQALPTGYSDVVLLYRKGLISAKGTGQSITDIRAAITSRVTLPLKVRIPHGTYFVSSGNHQNMVTRQVYEFSLAPQDTRSISVPATCINANLPVPSDNDRFSGVAHVSTSVSKFLEAAEGEDAMTIQAGVWALTDGYSGDQVRTHLVARDQYGRTRQAISDQQIDRARGILDRSGLSHRL